MIADNDIDTLDPQQLRQALRAAQAQVAAKSELVASHERAVAFKQTVIDKITHEMAVLKRLKFAARSEAFNAEQKSLLEETIDADLVALQAELDKESRAGLHAREFLGLPGSDHNRGWRGKPVCDDYSGYKQLLTMGVTKASCLSHARRKFFDLWANHKSTVVKEALKYFVQLYEVEREVQNLDPNERLRIRQLKAQPVADALGKWLELQRQMVPDGSATARAID